MADESDSIELPHDVALVLFELLYRYFDQHPTFEKGAAIHFDDQAEYASLAFLLACLEEIIAESFSSDYDDLLKKARDRIRWSDD